MAYLWRLQVFRGQMISPTQYHLEWPVAGLECKSGADNVMDRYFGVFSHSFPQRLVFESPVFALWNPKTPLPPHLYELSRGTRSGE